MALNDKLLLVLSAALIAGVGYYALTMPTPTPTPTTVRIGTTTVAVEVADSTNERTQGLSGRPSLAEGQGLLFIFDSMDRWGIWMKDMRFAIDIVWANDTVVTVAHQVSPDTYPQAFYPSVPARYVLELPAGYAAAHGIAEGAEFVVQ